MNAKVELQKTIYVTSKAGVRCQSIQLNLFKYN